MRQLKYQTMSFSIESLPHYKSGNQLSANSILIWRIVQTAVWLVGATIFFCLVFYPPIGVLLFWNILIPIAPALLVISVGLWRNVCPLASTNLLPRHLNWSKQKIMPVSLQGKLGLLAVVALYLIVPLRHAIFNTNGHATAILLFSCIVIGTSMGFIYDWKSGWCSTLCPVHPVEKLYGGNTIVALPNVHCTQCVNCSVPCPDSTPHIHPNSSHKTNFHIVSGILTIGGLPGFIWGWFHVPDNTTIQHLSSLIQVYSYPFSGLLVSLLLYLGIKSLLPYRYERKLISIFAATAVSFYYWYRVPALFGFGKFNKDGLLIDLSTSIPATLIISLTIALVVFFFWWLVIRKPQQRSWIVRPEFKNR